MRAIHMIHLLAQASAPNHNNFTNLPSTPATTVAIKTIMTIVFTITGAIAVIIVTIGGIKYASSQGDPQATAKAKGTIIYAAVGLIVSIFAAAIIQFAAGHIL
jgi:Type IV secretion system pilin